MSDKEKSEPTLKVSDIHSMFTAWRKSADLHSDNYCQPVTVDGITVTHRGPNLPPVIGQSEDTTTQGQG